MGRVYAVYPDMEKGERRGARCQVEQLGFSNWSPVRYITRVEFDDDADEGPALVTALKTDANGNLPTSHHDHVRYSFRCHARIILKAAAE